MGDWFKAWIPPEVKVLFVICLIAACYVAYALVSAVAQHVSVTFH